MNTFWECLLVRVTNFLSQNIHFLHLYPFLLQTKKGFEANIKGVKEMHFLRDYEPQPPLFTRLLSFPKSTAKLWSLHWYPGLHPGPMVLMSTPALPKWLPRLHSWISTRQFPFPGPLAYLSRSNYSNHCSTSCKGPNGSIRYMPLTLWSLPHTGRSRSTFMRESERLEFTTNLWADRPSERSPFISTLTFCIEFSVE